MSDLVITITPSTGSTVVFDGKRSVSIKAVAFVTLDGDEARRTFTSTDTEGKVSTYRLAQVTVYEDGSSWAWAAQMTKAGHPYKNGMGLQMGSNVDHGQDVADVVAEVLAKIETDRKLDELAARGQAILDERGETVDEFWAGKAKVGSYEPCDGCGDTDHAEQDCPARAKLVEAQPTELPNGAVLSGILLAE